MVYYYVSQYSVSNHLFFAYYVYRPEYLIAMVASSLKLCSILSKKLQSSEESHVTLLRRAFSCALCAIENANSLYTDEHGKTERVKSFNRLRESIQIWIKSTGVIGGFAFGRSVHSYRFRANTSWRGKEELKVNDYHNNNESTTVHNPQDVCQCCVHVGIVWR